MAGYKDLQVWQNNQVCIKESVKLFDILPQKYSFQHIAKQLFRSISSVGANIAEGHDSYEGKEFLRYINIAIRSAIESDHWLITLKSLSDLSELENLEQKNVEVVKMLKGLKRSIAQKRGIHS